MSARNLCWKAWALCAWLVSLVVLGAPTEAADASLQGVRCPSVDWLEAELFAVPSPLVKRIAESHCGFARVPLDFSGRMAGTVDLFVQRVPAAGTSRGAIVALPGGPGEAASSLTLQLAAALGPVLGDHELIILDQRGTGRSGALKCPTLERKRIGPLDSAVRACAAALGRRRAYYTTANSAEDIESVRRELGLQRLSLYGTSYGTKVALAYAQRYPAGTERLLLDSVVPLDGPDPFTRDVFRAVPRVLRALCANGSCRAATPDPVGDIAALVKRLAAGPLHGYVVGADGKRRARRLGRLRLLGILVGGDFDPTLRAEFPASVRAARLGDNAPLLRLARRASLTEGGTAPRTSFSPALFAATSCEDGPLPWKSTDPFLARWDSAIDQAGAIPDAAFFPFDRATGRASDTLRLCAHWPDDGPALQPFGTTIPDVQTLVLSGEMDLRTPSEEAHRVASMLPRATTLTVPFTGHAVLPNDLSTCAATAVRRFFADQPNSATCPQHRPGFTERFIRALIKPTPLPPTSLARVPRAPGVPGLAGRTLSAVELTVADFGRQFIYFSFGGPGGFDRIGGLRSGRLGPRGLDNYSYVPGVAVSTVLRGSRRTGRSLQGDFSEPSDLLRSQRLRITGKAAAHGTVTLDPGKGEIKGRLGGRHVRANLRSRLRLPAEEEFLSASATQNCCRFVR